MKGKFISYRKSRKKPPFLPAVNGSNPKSGQATFQVFSKD